MDDYDKYILEHSYVDRLIREGKKRNISFPSNGIPKTKVSSARVPSPAIAAFGLRGGSSNKSNDDQDGSSSDN